MNPNEEFHEVWWIWADPKESYGGLRIAHFRKTKNDVLIFFILGEPDDRKGVRIWDDVAAREGWTKIFQIPIPTPNFILDALR